LRHNSLIVQGGRWHFLRGYSCHADDAVGSAATVGPSFVPGCPARALGRDVREFQIGLIDAAAVCGSDMADEKSRLSISRLSLTPVETAVSTSR